MRKRQNRLFHFIALSFVFLGLSTTMMAQQEISGSVSDENGDPIIGASITVVSRQHKLDIIVWSNLQKNC